MSISSRIKEERQRLELSQSSFAELGGATKSAQIGWEKGGTAPNATVLAAWTEAGVDVTYILSGKRQADRRADTLLDISEQLARHRRELLDPDLEKSAERVRRPLQAIISYDAKLLNDEQRSEAEYLLDIAQDETKLSLFRAGEAVALRRRKEHMRRRLAEYFEGVDPAPSETVNYLLLQLAVDHEVPVRTLYELWEQIHLDANEHSD